MKSMVRSELWKALHNIYFYIALAFDGVIVLVGAVENYLKIQRMTQMTLAGLDSGLLNGGHAGMNLFLWALPYNTTGYAAIVFRTVWPILAAMPFGWSYSVERRSGLAIQIASRGGTDNYYVAKYAAVFVSGGLAVAVPVLADLLVNALICPYEVPDVVLSLISISNGGFLSELYYTVPWAHGLIWCVVVFFLGGAVAGLCFVVGSKLRLRVMVLLVPFVILMVWHVVYYNVVFAYFWEYLPNLRLSPLELISADAGSQNPEWFVLTAIGLLTVAGLGTGYWQVKRHELV